MSAFNCLHPVTVKTKYGFVKVPCNHCAACINRKSSVITSQCNIEAQKHRYVFFVTLTYANEFLPLCRVIKHAGRYVFVDCSSRDCVGNLAFPNSPVMSVVDSSTFTSEFFNMYYEKLDLPSEYHGLIPYLSRRDYQLFLKRLRKQLYVECNESIRYYVCGEYGPVHFRPHFHFLFFTDSDAVANCLRKCVSSSWSFGRIDFQSSQGGCADYCSKYINSLSHLSKIQRLACFRPFSAHSRYFAASFYQDVAEANEPVNYSAVNGRGIAVGSRFKQVAPWLALENNIYPKCYGFGKANSDVRLFVYTAYPACCAEFGETVVSTLATNMCESVFNGCPTPWVREFTRVFSGYYDARKLEQTFTSILYTSRKFLKLCSEKNLSPSVLLHLIESYYSSKDYFGLVNQLREQQAFIDQYGPDFRVFLICWYSNFTPIRQIDIDEHLAKVEQCEYFLIRWDSDHRFWQRKLERLRLNDPFDAYTAPILDYFKSLGLEPSFITDAIVEEDNPIYYQFASMQKAIAASSVKHKILQDKNKIFC